MYGNFITEAPTINDGNSDASSILTGGRMADISNSRRNSVCGDARFAYDSDGDTPGDRGISSACFSPQFLGGHQVTACSSNSLSPSGAPSTTRNSISNPQPTHPSIANSIIDSYLRQEDDSDHDNWHSSLITNFMSEIETPQSLHPQTIRPGATLSTANLLRHSLAYADNNVKQVCSAASYASCASDLDCFRYRDYGNAYGGGRSRNSSTRNSPVFDFQARPFEGSVDGPCASAIHQGYGGKDICKLEMSQASGKSATVIKTIIEALGSHEYNFWFNDEQLVMNGKPISNVDGRLAQYSNKQQVQKAGKEACTQIRNKKSTCKYTARYEILIPHDDDFKVTRKLIGAKGLNMRNINAATGAKLRLRGYGSGYLEGSSRKEAEEDLHLCISSMDYDMYVATKEKIGALLNSLYDDYYDYCVSKSRAAKRYTISMQENIRIGSTPV